MRELTLLKLGGSLITDKRRERAFRGEQVSQIASVIRDALAARPDLGLVIGHGSGSFGHMAARRYGTMDGVAGREAWLGFLEVARAAADLNALVAEALAGAGVPVMRLQPSAGTVCSDRQIVHWDLSTLITAMGCDLVPLIYGDVAFDHVRGGTITSTETLFFYLASHLPVRTILLLGEVAGVLDERGQRIPHITPQNLPEVEVALGGSAGTDVTGGMETKVRDMVALVQRVPGLQVRIVDGRSPERLLRVLLANAEEGTLITA